MNYNVSHLCNREIDNNIKKYYIIISKNKYKTNMRHKKKIAQYVSGFAQTNDDEQKDIFNNVTRILQKYFSLVKIFYKIKYILYYIYIS